MDRCPICKRSFDSIGKVVFCYERMEIVCQGCCAECKKCEVGMQAAREISPQYPQMILCNIELRDKYIEEYRTLGYTERELEALYSSYKEKLKETEKLFELKRDYRSKIAAVLMLLEEKKGA